MAFGDPHTTSGHLTLLRDRSTTTGPVQRSIDTGRYTAPLPPKRRERLSHAKTPPQMRAKEKPMADTVSRDELQAELRAIRSDSDAKFERIVGEMRVANTGVTSAISNLRTELSGDFKNLHTELTGEYSTLKAELKGDNEVTRARMAGKLTVWGAALSVVAAIVATYLVLVQIGQASYALGASNTKQIHEEIQAATKAAAVTLPVVTTAPADTKAVKRKGPKE